MIEQKTNTLESTFKSTDTEEWLDVVFTRPIGLWWARLFDRFGVHPNTVTILSMFIGALAGMCFYFTDLWHNVAGVLLLMWANFYDSADGQLARMTGKKTRWGRMLDGLAGDIWFFTIYVALCLRLHEAPMPWSDGTPWHWRIWLVAAVAGLVLHKRQAALADYYRNIHLYFLKGEAGSELDTYAQQCQLRADTPKAGNFWWRAFLWGYGNYTKGQEQMTPLFQRLMHYLRTQHQATLPESVREAFLAQSRSLMPIANILTFNCRAITLYVTCLMDEPWLYFVVEITLFTALWWWMRRRHERLCAHTLITLQQHAHVA